MCKDAITLQENLIIVLFSSTQLCEAERVYGCHARGTSESTLVYLASNATLR